MSFRRQGTPAGPPRSSRGSSRPRRRSSGSRSSSRTCRCRESPGVKHAMRHAVAPVLVIGSTLATLPFGAGPSRQGAMTDLRSSRWRPTRSCRHWSSSWPKEAPSRDARPCRPGQARRGRRPQLRRLADASRTRPKRPSIRCPGDRARNFTAATLVSLDLKDAPLRTAMESLSEQVAPRSRCRPTRCGTTWVP